MNNYNTSLIVDFFLLQSITLTIFVTSHFDFAALENLGALGTSPFCISITDKRFLSFLSLNHEYLHIIHHSCG